jgi:hypothetical protein
MPDPHDHTRWINRFLFVFCGTVLLGALRSHAQTVFVWDAGGDGVIWTDPDNWFNSTFNDYPHFSGDTAWVTGTGATGSNPPVLNQNVTLGNLQITSGGDVFNGLFTFNQFNVINETLISGTGSSLRIYNSPSSADLNTTTLTVNSTGTTDGGLILFGGSTAQINGQATVNQLGAISGNGVLRLNSTTGNIRNDGTILVPDDQTLQIVGSATNTGVFDWDGSAGNLAVLDIADDATLDIDLSQGNDAFGGTIRIGQLGELNNAFPWTLDTTGTIDFNGGTQGFPGIISGAPVTSRGLIDAEFQSGRFDADLTVTGGEVRIGQAGSISQLTVRDGVIQPAASINFRRGNFIVTGDFTIDQSGKLFDMDGALGSNTYFINDGTSLTINAASINPNTGPDTTTRFAGTLNISGTFSINNLPPTGWTNTGTINFNSGTILGSQFNHSGAIVVDDDSLIDASLIIIKNGSTTTLNNTGLRLGGPTTGAGFIDDNAEFFGVGTLFINTIFGIGDTDVSELSIVNESIFALVGNPFDVGLYRTVKPAFTSFNQLEAGELYIPIAGDGGVPGVDFSQADVGGQAFLRGQLTITMLGGFNPALGDSFNILTSSSRTGKFNRALLPDLDPGLGWLLSYTATDVVLSVITEIPGDLNYDGYVGIEDLNIVLGNWNQTVPPGNPQADPSGDNYVGIEDLNTVLGNWNAGTPPSVNANIPEPTTGILLIYASFPLAARTRRYK